MPGEAKQQNLVANLLLAELRSAWFPAALELWVTSG